MLLPSNLTEDGKRRVTWGFIIFLIAYVIYRHQFGGAQWILAQQRKILKSSRQFLASRLGLVRLGGIETIDVIESGPGWRILPLCFSLVNIVLSLSFLFDGNVKACVNILLLGFAFNYCVSVIKISHSKIVLFSRLMVVHQFFSLFILFGREIDGLTIRRAVLIRALGSLML